MYVDCPRFDADVLSGLTQLLRICHCSCNGAYVLPKPDAAREAAVATGAGAGGDAAASRSASTTSGNSTTAGTPASRSASGGSSSSMDVTAGTASVNKLFTGDMSKREQTEIKMMDDVLKQLQKYSAAAAAAPTQGHKKPFFIYHAPHAVHV